MKPSEQRPDRGGDRGRRADQRVRLLLRRALEVAVDQRLHRGQQERRAEPADDRPEDDDRGQALGERHRQGADGVAEQAQHVGPLAADEVADLAADQDERGRDQRLERDRRLDAADGRVEVLDHRRDRHVHQRRVDDEHEHRHRQQDGEPRIAGSLVRGRRRLRAAHRAPLGTHMRGQDPPAEQGRRITPSGRARPTVQTRLRRLTPIASRLPSRPGTRRSRRPASGRSAPGRSSAVSSYRSILRRTGSFISAKTRLMPRALSSSSRSCEHVGGGRVDVGDRLGGDDDPCRGRVGSGEARGSARGTCARSRRTAGASNRKMTQPGSRSALGVAAHVVVAGQLRDPARGRSGTATTPGGTRCRSTGRWRSRCRGARRAATTPRNAAIDSENSVRRCR